MNQPVSTGQRLYGMMQHLMINFANGKDPETPAARGVVDQDAAVAACLQLAAVIDEATQAGLLPADRGMHAASMLMVVRDYIRPLPPGLAADGVTDNLTPDLEEIVEALR